MGVMGSDVWLLVAALISGGVGLVGLVLWVRLFAHTVNTWTWRRSLVALHIQLPRTVTTEDVSRWVGMVRGLVPAPRRWSLRPTWPVCVETTATEAGVWHVLLVPGHLRGAVLSTLAAGLPGARIGGHPDDVTTGRRVRFRTATEARLTGAAEPLAVDRAEATSRHLLAALQPLEDGEVVRVQWLLTGARPPRWVADPATMSSELPELWDRDEPVFRAACRIAVASPTGRRRARVVLGRVWAALAGMNTARARVRRRWWWPAFGVVAWMLGREVPCGRWPMAVTASELGGLLGFAADSLTLPGLPVGVSRALPPSPAMPTTGLVIARSTYPGTDRPLCLSMPDRLRHLWVLGPIGSGKSTLLCNLICQDMARGDGLVLVDARGDLVADVLNRVPAERADDVIVIDPAESDHAVGLNPLTAGPPERAAGFVYHVLEALWEQSWGPRTADITRACLLTLTATSATDGSAFTLVDVPELLTNSGFRRSVLSQPGLSPQVARFWRWFNSLSDAHRADVCAPLLNKLRTFTMSTPLRAMLGQSSGVDFADVLAHKRIVLVALKKGLLGREVSGLVGSLVMASVWQAALARANLSADQRHPFWLIIDEFQDVVRLPLDVADILAQARGLGLGLTLAHQYMDQLTAGLKAAVVGTARSHIAFQLGYDDARTLAPHFDPLTADDLHHLGSYEIALRPCLNGVTAPPVTGKTSPMPPSTTDGAALAEASRRRYGQPVTDVDDQITARITPPAPRSAAHWNRISGGDQP